MKKLFIEFTNGATTTHEKVQTATEENGSLKIAFNPKGNSVLAGQIVYYDLAKVTEYDLI